MLIILQQNHISKIFYFTNFYLSLAVISVFLDERFTIWEENSNEDLDFLFWEVVKMHCVLEIPFLLSIFNLSSAVFINGIYNA